MLDDHRSVVLGCESRLNLFGKIGEPSLAVHETIGDPKVRILKGLPVSIKKIEAFGISQPILLNIGVLKLLSLIGQEVFVFFVECLRP